MTTEIIPAPAPELQPATLFTPTPKAAKRVLELIARLQSLGTVPMIDTPDPCILVQIVQLERS